MEKVSKAAVGISCILEVDEEMNKMSLRKALRVMRGYVDTIEKYYPGWCSQTEGIMGACQVVVEKVPEELSKEPTDEEMMQYCWKRNLVLISKEQYKALKDGK